MNICKLFSKVTESKASTLFNYIIGYNDVKRLVMLALDSDEQSHILLSGPPASAKTMFLESLIKLKKSYFVDGSFILYHAVIGVSRKFFRKQPASDWLNIQCLKKRFIDHIGMNDMGITYRFAIHI